MDVGWQIKCDESHTHVVQLTIVTNTFVQYKCKMDILQCAYLFFPHGLVAEKALKDVEHSAERSGGRAQGHQGEHSGQ